MKIRNVVYHVAATLDGFIAREDGSIDEFASEGDHVADYMEHLKTYDTVIMGRKTYEFGYRFGLRPGARAYPHMKHYVFSKSLKFENYDQVRVVRENALGVIDELKSGEGSDIYLCGGAGFAGFLLVNNRIDRLAIKMNPILFGSGMPLFQNASVFRSLKAAGMKRYDSGVMLLIYDVVCQERDDLLDS